MENMEKITYFAQTDFRNKKANFGIKAKDRTRHMYVIGKTGMGKSTLLENMAAQDIMSGEGMAFMDPHGSAVDKLLEYVPEHRLKDVVYFAPFDTDFPISFNILENVGPDKRHLVASGLMSVFKKIWVDAWSARMEYILNNILLALLEYPGSTLLGVNRMLADKDYRKAVVENVKDPSVKSFWIDEFAKYGDRYMQEAGAAIQNKIGQFATNPIIRNIIGQPNSSFDIRKMMDEKKILLMNLSKGRIGEQNANLLGGILITKIYLAAMSRADVASGVMKTLPHFYLYVDEFQSFASDSFADILSEARKYHLSLTIAHQYVEQMSEAVQAAVFGNVGTMVIFRVGATDAEIFEKEFAPQFTAEDIVNLGIFQIYMRLMIDGVGSKPFSAVTMEPIPFPVERFVQNIIDSSRTSYALPREKVEELINKWHEPLIVEKKERIVPAGISGTKPEFNSKPPFKNNSLPNPKPSFNSKASENPKSKMVEQEKAEPSMVKPENREYVEPVRPKENLRSLLEKLSIEPEKPKGELRPKIETKPKVEIKSKNENNPISPSLLKKSKSPDESKLNDLRALLDRVVPKQNNNTELFEKDDKTPKTVIQEKNQNDSVKNPTENQQQNSRENPKEVPEEVLRSILGS